jgi:hypothetical protein
VNTFFDVLEQGNLAVDNEVAAEIKSVPGHFFFTEQLTQALSLPVASIYPLAVASNNNTVNTTTNPVNMSKGFKRLLAHVLIGTLGANVTNVYAVFQSSNANNGTFANVASGAAATLNTTNSEVTLEMRKDQVPSGNAFVQLLVQVTTNTNAGNTVTIVGSIFGGEGDYKPANQFDYSTNTSILNRQVM